MGIVVLRNVPPGSHVGLDLHSWQTGPNFQGIRDVKEGLHCLHVAVHGITTTKYAAWLDMKQHGVIAYKWDKSIESLMASESPDTRQSEALFYVEFPSESDRSWIALTAHLKNDLLAKVLPVGTVLTSTTASNVDEVLSNLTLHESDFQDETVLHFLTIDLKRSWPAGASGRQLTEMSLDKTWLLGDVIQRIGGQDALLAEFELCFLCLLLFTSISAFDQWHIIFRLFCSAKSALSKHANLYASFLEILQAQMQQIPADLFSDIFALTVPRHLRLLRRNMDELREDQDVSLMPRIQENYDILVDTLNREFSMDDEDHAQQQATYPLDETDDTEAQEDDEDAPTVVEL